MGKNTKSNVKEVKSFEKRGFPRGGGDLKPYVQPLSWVHLLCAECLRMLQIFIHKGI